MPVRQRKVNVATLLGETGCSGAVIKRDLVNIHQFNGKTSCVS